MTIEDLIALLKPLPPSTRVFVDGYEGGLNDPEVRYPIPIELNSSPDSDVYGPHSVPGEWRTPTTQDPPEIVLGVIISRGCR